MKSFRSTLILLGLFGVLCAWYFGYEKKFKVEHSKKEETSKQLVTLDKDAIQEVEIHKIKKDKTPTEYSKLRLKKADSHWLIVEPIEYRADSSAVATLLSTITSTKQERVVDEKPAALETYGLKDPEYKIIVKKDSTTPAEEILVGSDTAIEFFAYAKVAGKDPVYKITRSLKSSVDKPVKDLRHKEILEVVRDQIDEVEVTNSKGNFVVKKTGSNWLLARENIPADTIEWNRSIDPIIQMRATDFASETDANLATFGLTKPLAKVTVTTADKARSVVTLGKVKDKVYAKRENKPTIFEVDKSVLEKIDKPATAFRNLKVADFNRFDISRIRVERPHNPLELVKQNTDWQLTEGNVKANPLEVDKFLTSLQDARLTTYHTGEKPTGDLKRLVLHLFEKKNNGPEIEKVVLSFADPKFTNVRVERSGLGIPFSIKLDEFKKLDLSKEALLKAEPPKEEKKEEKKG